MLLGIIKKKKRIRRDYCPGYSILFIVEITDDTFCKRMQGLCSVSPKRYVLQALPLYRMDSHIDILPEGIRSLHPDPDRVNQMCKTCIRNRSGHSMCGGGLLPVLLRPLGIESHSQSNLPPLMGSG